MYRPRVSVVFLCVCLEIFKITSPGTCLLFLATFINFTSQVYKTLKVNFSDVSIQDAL